MKNLKKAFTLVEMMIVVIIIGILIASLLPKLNIAQIQARNITRIDTVKYLKKEIINTIKNNTWIIEQLSWLHTYCVDNNLKNVFWDEIYRIDPIRRHINYWTQSWGCIWQYGFIYNKEVNKIWLITTLEDWEGILSKSYRNYLKKHFRWNYNLDLNYYKNFSWDYKQFQNVFDKNNWEFNLWETTTWNSYIEVIDLNYLLWKNKKWKQKQ